MAGWVVAAQCNHPCMRTRQGEGASTHAKGGAITLVRESADLSISTPPQRLTAEADKYTAANNILVHAHDNPTEPLQLVNLYIPPSREATDAFDPAALPHGPNTVVLGDLNAYHHNWAGNIDSDRDTKIQWAPGTRRIEEVVEGSPAAKAGVQAGWDLHAVNGQHTKDAHEMTQAIQVAPPRQGGEAEYTMTLNNPHPERTAQWRVLDDGGSDHYPICFDYPFYKIPPKPDQTKRWKLKKANWEMFQQTTEQAFAGLAKLARTNPTEMSHMSPSDLHDYLTKTMWAVAKAEYGRTGTKRQCVPRAANRRNAKPWWNKRVEQAVERRKRARECAHESLQKEEHYRLAVHEAERVMRTEKTKAWGDYISNLDPRETSTTVFRMMRVFDGRLPQARPNPTLRQGDGELAITPEQKAKALLDTYEAR
eukprot:gene4137-22782_t